MEGGGGGGGGGGRRGEEGEEGGGGGGTGKEKEGAEVEREGQKSGREGGTEGKREGGRDRESSPSYLVRLQLSLHLFQLLLKLLQRCLGNHVTLLQHPVRRYTA